MHKLTTSILLACALALAAPALADPADDRPWSGHLGTGFGLSPDGFLLTAGLEYEVVDQLGVGPLLQLVLDDDTVVVAPTLNARYRIDLSDSGNDFLRDLEPYVQAGMGLAYVDRERRGRSDREDTEFLVNGGFGFEYNLSDRFAIGNGVMFNGMPADDAAGEDFFFTWQLVTARLRF